MSPNAYGVPEGRCLGQSPGRSPGTDRQHNCQSRRDVLFIGMNIAGITTRPSGTRNHNIDCSPGCPGALGVHRDYARGMAKYTRGIMLQSQK